MEANIATIKQELERRFSLTTRNLKFFGHKYIGPSYAHIHSYIQYIQTTPVLREFVVSETKHHEAFVAKLSQENTSEDKTIIQLSNFRDFNLYQGYEHLERKVFKPIDQLGKETDYSKLDPWALAVTKSPKQIFFELPLPITKHAQVLVFKAIRSTKTFQEMVKRNMREVHHRLMNMLAEYEIQPPRAEESVEPPSEAVTKLNLTPDSKWEDITIKFKDDYLVSISYRSKELETRHEAMGFADKRKADEFRAKDSWLFLQLLSTQNGIFSLNRVTGKNRIKRQKQKQELAKLLKQYFQINDDPFYETDKDNPEYKIKIKLIPDPEFRLQWRDRDIYDSTNVPRKAYLINFKDDENSSL